MWASEKGRELVAKIIESEKESMTSSSAEPFAAPTPRQPPQKSVWAEEYLQTIGELH